MGNIRELRNLIERASVLFDGEKISEKQFEMAAVTPEEACGASSPSASAFVVETPIPLKEAERRYIAWAAVRFDGDRAALAKRLALSPRTLCRKLATRAESGG